MSRDLGQQVIRLGERLANSEGMRIQRAWLPVHNMYRAFRGNGNELLRLVARQKAGDPIPIFWESAGERPAQALLFEVQRLLLNYLGSAFALLAHQQNVVGREYAERHRRAEAA